MRQTPDLRVTRFREFSNSDALAPDCGCNRTDPVYKYVCAASVFCGVRVLNLFGWPICGLWIEGSPAADNDAWVRREE
jgi:hypothetical protein